jgi:hypothetical protein
MFGSMAPKHFGWFDLLLDLAVLHKKLIAARGAINVPGGMA